MCRDSQTSGQQKNQATQSLIELNFIQNQCGGVLGVVSPIIAVQEFLWASEQFPKTCSSSSGDREHSQYPIISHNSGLCLHELLQLLIGGSVQWIRHAQHLTQGSELT